MSHPHDAARVPHELGAAVLTGNRRALARAITLVEQGGRAAHELLRSVYAASGRAHIIGVTGAPGAGKSTLVSALATHWRAQGRSLGILAIDPTSPFTGGAILGDRIRMQSHGGDTGVFIRSMASRGRVGGIARATSDAALLLDAAGFDIVLIETVGAGQGEIEIASAAETTLVVEIPGAGDDVQSIKAGILEIADVFAVNKADRDGADALVNWLRTMLRIVPTADDAWIPPVVPVSALMGTNIAELVAALEQHRAFRALRGLDRTREAAADAELRRIVQETALVRLLEQLPPGDWQALITQIVARELDPYAVAHELIDAFNHNDRHM